MMPQPIVVEFVGMMGAGKTTIAHLVIDELQRRGYKCPSIEVTNQWKIKSGLNNVPRAIGLLEKLHYYSKFSYLIAALQFPIITFQSYRYALNVVPQNRDSWQSSRTPMNWKGIFKKYIWNSSYDIVVLDDGVVQCQVSIPLGGEQYSSSAQRKLISTLMEGENHLFVAVKTDTVKALERIQLRAAEVHREGFSSWRFGDETEEYQVQKADQAISLFESTFKHLKALRPDSVIEIDSRIDPKENAERVLAFIDRQTLINQTSATTSLW